MNKPLVGSLHSALYNPTYHGPQPFRTMVIVSFLLLKCSSLLPQPFHVSLSALCFDDIPLSAMLDVS